MPNECDYFLKIAGIDGESHDAKHPNEIQIADFKIAVSNRGRRGDYKVGKTTFEDARFFCRIDQAYPKLTLACTTGEHIASAVLTCRKQGGGQKEYLVITLSDIVIKSCKILTEKSDILPNIEFTIGFSKQQVEYREQ